jgi:predicted ester cyclase
LPASASALARRQFEEFFNQRRPELADELFAERFVEHALAPFGETEPGSVHGPAHMRTVLEWLVAQFPDIRMEIEAIVADGDTVAVRVLSEGTNLGLLNGVVPPTGRTFAAHQTHWFRAAGGRLAEHWATRDDLTAMLQLGVIRRPGPRPAAVSPRRRSRSGVRAAGRT